MTQSVCRVLKSTIGTDGNRSRATARKQYGKENFPSVEISPTRPPHLCKTCGARIGVGHRFCSICKISVTRIELLKASEKGRSMSHTASAELKRAENRRRNIEAQMSWKAVDQPAWLDDETFLTKIQPLLSAVRVSDIQTELCVSKGYATIRSGKRVPHARHWQMLANLVGMTSSHSA
jgi:hypothetical protein